ncbi:MAG: adenylate/guanylate cyclase domain-containing protein [Pirellulales bacterium]|nr:adenylate/guanylate cyclase domain-containing protein [Pirellulales bacterium]
MAHLVAQGREPRHYWRRRLRPNDLFVLGRAADDWSVIWDERLSRRHVEIVWRQGRLYVQKVPAARNPVFCQGQENDQFSIAPGEHFVIGETTFTLLDERLTIASRLPKPAEEQTFTSDALRSVSFRNAHHRLEVLGRLPEVISGAANNDELCVRLVNLLLSGLPRAAAVALVATDPDPREDSPVAALHWDRRFSAPTDFQPSRTLIINAVQAGHSKLHVWGNTEDSQSLSATMAENFDWAFCTPVPNLACAGWALYVAGTLGGPTANTPNTIGPGDLKEDVKFTEIVAATLGSLQQLQSLQQRNAALAQFFPPAVLDALERHNPQDVLAPKEAEVSVLFCDLRGFSLDAERHGDDLMGLLRRVSKALGVMAQHILDEQGVIGDFQGDAAMGFWGWPLESAEMVRSAALAALAIRQEFEAAARRPDHPLANFRVGIGIATGRAVSGGIGTSDQLKVTVFGPVVNLASRLEGMTKLLQAPILLDETTAAWIRQHASADQARVRRVARVRPYGMDVELEVAELLPPDDGEALTDEQIADYESALDSFIAGDWSLAWERLHKVPPADQVKDVLTEVIVRHKRVAPPDWNGVINLDRKS